MKKIIFLFVSCFGLNSFCQVPGSGVTDVDGNIYNSVIIGAQEWMKTNLNVSKYLDGTIIPQVTDVNAWASLTTGAWCYPNNDNASGIIYGKLYNWYAIMGIYDAASLANPLVRKQFAPTGWHVPSDSEWTILGDYLGGDSVAGGKMREAGTAHWLTPNSGADNSSCFTGLPAGYLNISSIPIPTFALMGLGGHWWSSSETASQAWYRSLNYSYNYVNKNTKDKAYGLSVRCVKDIAMGNESFNDSSFKIFPNPAKNYITIDFGDFANLNGWSFKIVDTLGQEIVCGIINSQHIDVSLNNINSEGILIIKILNNKNEVVNVKKILIQ